MAETGLNPLKHLIFQGSNKLKHNPNGLMPILCGLWGPGLPQNCMGYGVLESYGLWVGLTCIPTGETKNCMGYGRLWVIRVMGYKSFNCTWMSILG